MMVRTTDPKKRGQRAKKFHRGAEARRKIRRRAKELLNKRKK